jgi:hypothetical protein
MRFGGGDGCGAGIAYVPLSFAPGEAYQFDWSHEVVVMSGVTVTVKVAHADADDGDRQMVAILAAALTDGLPEVEAACAQGPFARR